VKTLLQKVRDKDRLGVLGLAFSNLAQSAERQQRPHVAKLLSGLALSYQIQAVNASQVGTTGPDTTEERTDLQAQIKAQLDAYAPLTEQATELGERGVLRALLWGQKVTMIQNSLLNRLNRQGAALFKENQGIHVCEACGFVILKEGAPDICPICKAPRQRFVSL
jgi:rubrerythrin